MVITKIQEHETTLDRSPVRLPIGAMMSFVHLEYVGHFAPDDPIVMSNPFQPKPTKPIDRQEVVKLVEETGGGIERLLWHHNGYLVCEWTRDSRIRSEVWEPFIRRLADRTNAVIMNQHGLIYYPEDAKAAYAKWLKHLKQEST